MVKKKLHIMKSSSWRHAARGVRQGLPLVQGGGGFDDPALGQQLPLPLEGVVKPSSVPAAFSSRTFARRSSAAARRQ